ncbi:MAG: hypothetical protein OEV59_09615 [Deltaproteobacteria bacterium]|nr:hypothetical protein [Deltaproteobacteria bacterium]
MDGENKRLEAEEKFIGAVQDHLGIKLGMPYEAAKQKMKCGEGVTRVFSPSDASSSMYLSCVVEKDGDRFYIILSSSWGYADYGEAVRVKGIVVDSKKFRLKDGVGVGTDFGTFKKVYGSIFGEEYRQLGFAPHRVYFENSRIFLEFKMTKGNTSLVDSDSVDEIFILEKNIPPHGMW